MSRSLKAKVRFHPAAIRAAMPVVIEPMLPTLTRRPFSGSGWLFEPKWDGWRTICVLRDGKTHFLSRKGNSLDERFPELRHIVRSIKATTAILDGEIVALDKEGLPCFDGLHGRKRHCAIVFFVFDLLYVDGHDLTQVPLISRKEGLRRIVPKRNTGRIRYTDHVVNIGERLFAEVDRLKLEGVVAKRKDSVYSPMRSRDWLKIKTAAGREEMQKRIETWDRS